MSGTSRLPQQMLKFLVFNSSPSETTQSVPLILSSGCYVQPLDLILQTGKANDKAVLLLLLLFFMVVLLFITCKLY